MRINPNDRSIIDTYKSHSKKNDPVVDRNVKPEPELDRAEISPKAREIMECRARLGEIPGIRMDLVDSIKSRIKNGTYEPSAQKIAEGIIREIKDS